MRPAVALAALLAVACQREPGPRELRSGALVVQVPAAWQVGSSPQSEWLVRPVDDGVLVPGAFVLLASDPARAGVRSTLDEYVAYRQGWTGASWDRLEVVDGARVVLGGVPAERREWLAEGRAPARRMLALMWVDGAGGHALIASAPVREFERLRPRFRRLFDSATLTR